MEPPSKEPVYRPSAAHENDCLFCKLRSMSLFVAEFGEVFAILDKFPVTRGHHLIVSKRHVTDWFGLSFEERRDAEALLSELKRQIQREDSSVTGFNIGMNCGESAGQTVMHAHIHLIPRRSGDVADPRGGVRGCIPGKMGY